MEGDDDSTGEDLMNLIEKQPDALMRQIEDVIARAKPPGRDIFLAVRFDNASYEELAERHGISAKRVEKAIARLMTRILLVGRPRRWQFWRR